MAGESKPRGTLMAGDLVGRYRILTHLADGGMAAVYLAELDGPSGFRKRCALKVIHRHLMKDREFVQMFVNEAWIAARLDHPNIVQTFDLVRTKDFLAFAMEYAPGLPLIELYPDGKLGLEPSPELVAYVGVEAAAGLHHAHTLVDSSGRALGVVHRDVTPRNVQIGWDGRIRVVDFGIAQARGRLGATAAGQLKGTFAYLSPEQVSQGEIDARSDVWSLGVVLWELLARRRLFRGETDAETIQAVQKREIPPLAAIRDDVPESLADAIAKALTREAAGRWTTAHDFEEALREALPRKLEPVRAPLLAALVPHREAHQQEIELMLEEDGPERLSSEPPLLSSEPPAQPPKDRSVRTSIRALTGSGAPRRRVLAIAAAGVVFLALIALFAATRGSDPPARPTTTSAPVARAPSETTAPASGSAEPGMATPTLRIESNRDGAWVEIDGADRQALPLDVTDLPAGTVLMLEVGAPGCSSEEVEAVVGDRPVVRVRLDRRHRPHGLAKNPFRRR